MPATVTAALEAYFARFGFRAPAIAAPPAPGLGLVVVIPCREEPHLEATLHSLAACTPPDCGVEVIVVVNGAADAPAQVRECNARGAAWAREWAAGKDNGANTRPGLAVHVLEFPDLPPRQAGVGLARKIGMDEALARLHGAHNPNGIIASLDADSLCAPNYLRALERHFREHPASEACALHFEHRLQEAGNPRIAEAIIHYELYLRTFNLALKLSGYPFAHHTLGSCFAVRAGAYRAQGGMNRRQAGEDFYFLNKFMTLGTFSELRATTVFPSPRASHRVPFGTGRAIRDWLSAGPSSLQGYDTRVFTALGELLPRARELHALSPETLPAFLASLPAPLAEFLQSSRFGARLAEMQRNSATPGALTKRFYRWFDRFRVLKYVHFASARHYPRIGVTRAAAEVLAWGGAFSLQEALAMEAEPLLHLMRNLERDGKWLPPARPWED